VFVFPIEMFGKVELPEHYAPFYSVFVYRNAEDAAAIFKDPRVLEKRMYASVFGDVKEESTTAIVRSAESSGHETLVNTGLFESEDGNLPFGGRGRDTSIIAELKYGGSRVEVLEENRPILVSREILAPSKSVAAPPAKSGLRYVRGDPKRPISFGIEIELNVRENPRLVEYYRIPSIAEPEWERLSSEARVQKSIAWEKEIYKDYKAVAYVRRASTPKTYPEKLLNESNGNVEMNGLVFDTDEGARAFLKDFETRFGTGALQGHVVAEKGPLPGLAGYTVFKADENQLATLEKGYARYLSDPKSIPGKSLMHHSLAPLYQEDVEVFRSFEKGLAEGDELPHVHDSKHLNAPVMRGGGIYGKTKMGFEGRQFHRRADDLIEWQKDLATTLENDGDLSRYEIFAEARQIQNGLLEDRLRDVRKWKPEFGDETRRLRAFQWNRFQADVGKWVREQVPHIDYGGRDTGMRMFFPLRPWADHPVLATLKSSARDLVEETIHTSTLEYIQTLERLAKTDGMSGADVLARIQIANAKWAHDVQLSKYFSEAKKQIAQPGTKRRSLFAGAPLPFAASISESRSLDGAVSPRIRLKADVLRDKDYEDFLDDTVEILYEPNSLFGHISLRVGRIHYNLGNTRMVDISAFKPSGHTGFTRGAVYRVGRERVAQTENEIRAFYEALKSDVPPFDSYSRMFRVIEDGEGAVELVADAKGAEARVQKRTAARVNREGKSISLVNTQGFKTPIILKEGEMWIRSYSCTTSTTTVLKGKFSIPFEFDYVAKNLNQTLFLGNPLGRLPDVLVDYR